MYEQLEKMIKAVSIYGGNKNEIISPSDGTGVANLLLVPYSHFFLLFLLSFSVGFKTKVDETNQKIVQKLVAGKNDEYHNNVEIVKISKEYEAQKVSLKVGIEKALQFHPLSIIKWLIIQFCCIGISQIEFYIDVHAGPCPKVVAVKAARKLRATWVIIDRSVKHQTF